MLVIWSSADARLLKDVVGKVVARHGVEHRVFPKMDGLPEGVKTGDVVLACGGKAMDVLRSVGLVPKNRTVTSLREKPVVLNGVTYLITFDPGVTTKDYARFPEMQWDTQLACRLVETGSVRPKTGTYRYVESLFDLMVRIEQKHEETGKPVKVSCDLETKSFNPYDKEAWIIACSFTVDEGFSDVLYFEKHEKPVKPFPWVAVEDMSYWEGLWTQIHWVLTTDMVSIRGANFKYDSNWMVQKWGIYCDNHRFDTMLVGSLLDENRSNSLKLHAKIMTSMGGYEDDMDKYDFACLEMVPKGELLEYVGGDTDATYRVAEVMQHELMGDRKLSNFYVKLLHPSSKVFEKLERNGILVDVAYYDQLESEVRAEISRIRGEMVSLMPAKMRIKYKDDFSKAMEDDKSPFTPSILKEFLFTPYGINLKPKVFTEKTKEPSTSMDHLMMFEDDPVATNFIGLFRELGSAMKTLSTYIVGFRKHLRPDNRFHATYMLHRGGYGEDNKDSGTNTGRTSAKDPAVQTIPKHSKWAKRLRRAFIAPPGMAIIQLDFSQGELRIAAVVAEEPTMIKAYRDGLDLHAITAAQLNGYAFEEFMLLPEDVRDELRSGGKAGNFGLIYGMQHVGFKEYAYTTYGVQMTEEEAFQKREAFFGLYSRLPEWHAEYKQHAHRWGFVRSPLGRVRHLPLINSKDREVVSQSERQSINSPIQSCLSDMMQLAMVHIDREYGDRNIQMFLMTHDSLALYVPEDEAQMWAKRCKDIMENLPLEEDFGWRSPLKFVADAEMAVAGDDGVVSFATLKKLKNL